MALHARSSASHHISGMLDTIGNWHSLGGIYSTSKCQSMFAQGSLWSPCVNVCGTARSTTIYVEHIDPPKINRHSPKVAWQSPHKVMCETPLETTTIYVECIDLPMVNGHSPKVACRSPDEVMCGTLLETTTIHVECFDLPMVNERPPMVTLGGGCWTPKGQ